MRLSILILLMFLLVDCLLGQNYPSLEYQLIPSVSDEFESTNSALWDKLDQGYNQYRDDGGIGNHYDTNYAKSGQIASIPNSSKVAKLFATYSSSPIPTWDANTLTTKYVNYRMGVLCHKQKFKYGYYEARVKIPSNNVKVCSAFWMWNQNAMKYTEIDVFENTPVVPNNWMLAMHYGPPFQDSIYKYNHIRASDASCLNPDWQYLTSVDFSNSFQTFGLEWQPNYIRYYLNGVLIKSFHSLVSNLNFTYSEISVSNMDIPQYLIFFTKGDTACGLNQPNLDVFEIDYFRYYKQKPRISDFQMLAGNQVTLTVHTDLPEDVFTWEILSPNTNLISSSGKSAQFQLPVTGNAIVKVNATGNYPVATSSETITITPNSTSLCGAVITNGLYRSTTSITAPASPCSTFVIPTGANVVFTAPNSIYLNPGFEVKSGASFYAKTN